MNPGRSSTWRVIVGAGASRRTIDVPEDGLWPLVRALLAGGADELVVAGGIGRFRIARVRKASV